MADDLCPTREPGGAIRRPWRSYAPLIKAHQTGLLVLTGVAGYTSASCPVTHWPGLIGLIVSLGLSVSGSTMLNMVYDRDIDAKMTRTCHRPLASGMVSPTRALLVGSLLSLLGVGIAFALSPLCGGLVLAGLFFDVVVYTMWLKRRNAWSILWGGIAGAMPVMAGRALGVGGLDAVGGLLGLAVLSWIPTHIVTYTIRHGADYAAAGVPTLPALYGPRTTRSIIVASCAAATLAILVAGVRLGMLWGSLGLLAVFSAVILGFAVMNLLRPSARLNFALFKLGSAHMAGAMLLITLEALI